MRPSTAWFKWRLRLGRSDCTRRISRWSARRTRSVPGGGGRLRALLGLSAVALRARLWSMLSTPGTYARREAAKAFNFQLIALVAFVVVGMLGGITGLDIFGWLMPFMGLGWLILTIVGGAKALQGENWKNPVRRVVPLQVLSEK